jgi:hypothetical protein
MDSEAPADGKTTVRATKSLTPADGSVVPISEAGMCSMHSYAVAARARAASAEGLLEGSGRERFERKAEDFTVRAEALECPREISLDRDGLSAALGDDAEEHAGTVSSFGAALPLC